MKTERNFPNIVKQIITLLLTDQVSKVMEDSLSILEFLIQSLPESIFSHIESIVKILVR